MKTSKLATALIACATAVTLVACGSEEEAPATTSHAAATSAGQSAAESGSATAGSSSKSAAGESTEEAESGSDCGRVSGPDGALHVWVDEGSTSCEAAMELADKYSPLIATGKPQSVDGWSCGPSAELEGELARCTKDDKMIVFTVF